jgi:hypothetical protein
MAESGSIGHSFLSNDDSASPPADPVELSVLAIDPHRMVDLDCGL